MSRIDLPQKENNLFQKLMKCYEQKQFKNGLRHAKAILSNPKCTDHGETLSMKGLILSAMNKREEALELARKGLSKNFRSGTCWHVYGLVLRAEKKYEEAIKAYSNAVKWENRNQLILKDLSHLQIQMRDYEAFKKSRLDLLTLRPTLRASWIGFAVANHLLGEHDTAFEVLEEFRTTQNKSDGQRSRDHDSDYENSEIIVYQAKILIEQKKHTRAIEFLEKNRAEILDIPHYHETLGDLRLILGENEQAEEHFTILVHRNPEKRVYFEKLAQAVEADADPLRINEFYDTMANVFSRSKLPLLIPLELVIGEIFTRRLEHYFKASLRKCLPNIHVTLRPIYSDAQKRNELEQLALRLCELLEKNQTMEEDGERESPACLVWLYHFLAQHFDFLKNYEMAMHYVNLALEHTPTITDLYVTKGRIYKHAGHIKYAAACLDEAQSLDTADRYLNCKCCRYLIRAGEVEKAEKMAEQFTRENTTVQENLKEMQVLWFQIECAQAYYEQGKYGLALRKCYEIENVFADVTEDQFDFHNYCMRKMTLGEYVEMLRWEDSVREQKYFQAAALIAVNIYIQIHDGTWNPETGGSTAAEANLSEAELKKLKSKKKKEALKKKKEDEKKKKEGAKRNTEPVKEDPLEPEKLLKEAQEKALEKAKEWCEWLETLSPNWLPGQVAAYELAKRRNRPFQQLRAVKRLINHHGLDNAAVHFTVCDWISQAKQTIAAVEDEVVSKVLTEGNDEIMNLTGDVTSYNKKYLSENKLSYQHRLQVALIAKTVEKSDDIETIIDGDFSTGSIDDYKQGIALSNCLKLREAAKSLFPLATEFGAEFDNPPRMLKEFDQINGHSIEN
ncbi:unnamed protein product [Oikopleura dioica]|uniref:N-alpha-acetyltransferase 15, NatA auxiliary subunit n=1 Tax=Oikopleura dioica TaxID=34765 RepID=E4WRG2_OIKDI|nr:unnamed protein product [Oikopleura dioica]CBY36626.1 unnamed protein product [Oikopleura dioica]